MPVVPKYQGGVQENAYQAPRMSPAVPIEAFNAGPVAAGAERAASGAADVVQKIIAVERQKADRLNVLNQSQELSSFVTDLLYNDKTGAMNTKGQQIFGMPDQVKQSFSSKISELTQGLHNDNQRQGFQQIARESYEDVNRQIQKHFHTERMNFDTQVTNSFLANEQDAAAKSYLYPERIQTSIENQTKELIEHAGRNGLPEDWITQNVSEAVSKTHTAVISRFLSNDMDIKAQAYFNLKKDYITAKDAKALEESLKEGSTRGESQRQTDLIMKKTTDMGEALEKARQIKNSKVRERTEQLVEHRFRQNAAAIELAQKAIYEQAAMIIDKTPGISEVDVRNVVDASSWAKMTPAMHDSLVKRASDPPNDDKTWLKFLDLDATTIANLDRTDFETKYWSKFDRSRRSRAESMWSEAKQKAGTPGAHVTDIISPHKQLINSLKTAHLIDPKKPFSKYDEDAAEFLSRMENVANSRLQEFETEKLGGKRKATFDERQKIFDDIIKQDTFVDKTSWYKKGKTGFLTTENITYARIPQADKDAIENMFRSKNAKLTQDRVVQAYKAYRSGDSRALRKLLEE